MEQNNNKEKYPPFPSLAKPIENKEVSHNIQEKYYYTEPTYRNYSIHDFYENLPPSYFRPTKNYNRTSEGCDYNSCGQYLENKSAQGADFILQGYKSEKYKDIKSKTYDDTIFKIYMGGIAIVGLYIFYNIIEK